MADMLLHPTFPADALERLRARTLVQLVQAKDQPTAIASNVFARTLYGDAHPYGRVVTDTSVKAITRDDVVAFHRAYFQPARATITVSATPRSICPSWPMISGSSRLSPSPTARAAR